jgi:hypothetical protein
MLAHSAPHISRTMSITHADFLRTLAQAVSGCDYRVQGNEIFVSLDSDAGVYIHMGEEHSRRVEPSVDLPEVQVDMDFVGLTEEEAGVFLQRFDRYFRYGSE